MYLFVWGGVVIVCCVCVWGGLCLYVAFVCVCVCFMYVCILCVHVSVDKLLQTHIQTDTHSYKYVQPNVHSDGKTSRRFMPSLIKF